MVRGAMLHRCLFVKGSVPNDAREVRLSTCATAAGKGHRENDCARRSFLICLYRHVLSVCIFAFVIHSAHEPPLNIGRCH